MSVVPMKDSGVEWLGEIPAHWNIIPIHAVTLATGKHDPSREPDREFRYIDVSRICSDVHEITEYEQLAGRDAPTRARNVVYEGDTIFATIRPYLRNIAPIPIDLHDSICSTGYCVLRAKRTKVNPHYLFFSCISAGFVASVVAHQKGANYPAVSDHVVQRQVISLPPLAEQRAIAAYLDRQTARIDALTAKTQQLNALLSEKRVALISQAVTRGLDPAAPLKDSGVEWLGEIPAHWDVKLMRKISKVVTSTSTFDSVQEYFTADGVEVLSLKVSDMNLEGNRCGIVMSDESLNIFSDVLNRVSTVPPNSLIFPKRGAAIYTNKKRLVHKHSLLDPNLIAVVPFHQLLASFLYYWFLQYDLRGITDGSAVPQLNKRNVDFIDFPLPPLSEQRAIAHHLDRRTASIDALIAKNDQLIALLREKRTSLISAAVTGKIDLRNGA